MKGPGSFEGHPCPAPLRQHPGGSCSVGWCLVVLLAAAAIAVASSASDIQCGVDEAAAEGACDELGLMMVEMRRVKKQPMLGVERLVPPQSSSMPSGKPLDLQGPLSSHHPIYVATATEVTGSAFSFSASEGVFGMPGNTFGSFDGDSSSALSQFPVLQVLAQRFWLTFAGGVMIVSIVALNRARTTMIDHAQHKKKTQVKQGTFLSWRIDPDMVRSSACNSAG